MEERIKAQVKDSDPAEVKELILDNVRETTLVGLNDKFTSLATLSAIHVGLTSLEGLPSLPSLTKVELGDNKLTGGLETLSQCPELRHLSLVGNRLASVDLLTPLKSLEKLETLDLLDCPLTKQENYRDQVFSLLPSLKSLDGLNQAGEEVEESDSEGEEEEEEEEGEGESEGDEEEEEDGVGLDYLNRNLDSDESSEGGDYDPEADGDEEDEDHLIPSDDGGEAGEDDVPSAKRQKVSEQDTEQKSAQPEV